MSPALRSRRAAALLLAVLLATAAPVLGHGGKSHRREADRRGPARGRVVRLALPPPPILAGDVLALTRHRAFRDREVRRLLVLLGRTPLETVRLDARTVGAVIPPGVGGRQRLRVIDWRTWWWPRIVLRERIELAPIDLKTAGPGRAGTEFGLHFPTRTVEAGDPVKGWVRTPTLVTEGTSSAPVSVSGRVLARTESTATLELTGDAKPASTQSTEVAGTAPSGLAASGTLVSLTSLGSTTLTTTVDLFRDTFGSTVTLRDPDAGGVDLGGVEISLPIEPTAVTPVVKSIAPSPAPPGAQVEILGEGFGATQGRSRVVLGGQPVVVFPEVEEWRDDRIVIRLPAFAQGPYDFRVIAGLEPSLPQPFEIDPICPAVPEFTRSFGGPRDDRAFAIAQLPDCGYVLAGRTGSRRSSDQDVLLIRTDRFGDEVWTRTFGGSDFDEARAVHVSGGHVYFAGSTRSKEYDLLDQDFLVGKVQLDGDLVWARAFGREGDDHGRALVPAMDHNHGIDQAFVVGGTTRDAVGGADGLLVWVDADGKDLARQVVGGKGDDRIDGLLQVPSTGILAVGRSDSPELGAVGRFEPFAAMLEFDGRVRWQRAYPGGSADDALVSAGLSEAGTLVLTGQVNGLSAGVDEDFASGGNTLLMEIDEGGEELDRVSFGGNFRDVGTAGPFLQRDRGLAVVGFTKSPSSGGDLVDGVLLKTDCSLAPSQAKLVDLPEESEERLFAGLATRDDGFAVAGELVHTPAASGRDDADVLLAVRGRFEKLDVPEIELFEANGQAGLQVRNGDPVSVRWRVQGATNVRIERLGAVGPALDVDEGISGFVDQTAQIPSFSLGAGGCGDLCGDVVYRITARSECGEDTANLTVTVVPTDGNVSPDEERLLEIESIIVQRFDRPAVYSPGTVAGAILTGTSCYFGICSNTYQQMPGSHLDLVSDPLAPTNVCIAGSGYPLANATPGVALGAAADEIDDTEPPLLSYRADGQVASWSYGSLFFERGDTTPPSGVPVPDSAWFGHYSGWHTGDGGMTVWGMDELTPEIVGVPFQPPKECPRPPELGGGQRVDYCGTAPAPVYPHPNAWDVHMFRDIEGGGILRHGGLSYDAQVTDPCTGVDRTGSDCETGDAPMTVPGSDEVISVFPAVDFATGTFVPTACRPGP